MDEMDLIRALHPKAEEYTFFSTALETFSKRDHILGHKTSLSKFKKTINLSSIFSDHNGMKLEITRRKLKNIQTHGG